MDEDALPVEKIIKLDPNGKYILRFKKRLSPDDFMRLEYAVKQWRTRADVPFLVTDLDCEVVEVRLPRVIDGDNGNETI